jgi:hypothetical protein
MPYSFRRRERHRQIKQTVTYAVIFALLVLFFGTALTTWHQRRRPDLFPVEDGLYRYAGAIHVHSRFSDGSGTVEEIAAAAKEAGLDYVFLTDHNPLKASAAGGEGYRNGVLLLIGEEINTSGGHLLALGAGTRHQQKGPQGLPALLDTIAALGGLAVIAHPDGRHPWRDWSAAPIHGIEVFNADTEWRNDGVFELLSALCWYPWMPEAAMNTLIDRPDGVMARWHGLAQRRPVTGIASVDAHARIPLPGGYTLRFPPYALMFRLLRTYAVTDTPLTGDKDADRRRILEALRAGHCYMAVDGYEQAIQFRFELIDGDRLTRMGDRAPYRHGSRIHTVVGSSGPVMIRLFRNGVPLVDMPTQELTYPISAPGLYHVEVYQMRRWFPYLDPVARPWIIANPIRVE